MLNGNTVATLTFNQLQSRNQQNQDGSMFNQLYQYQQHEILVEFHEEEYMIVQQLFHRN